MTLISEEWSEKKRKRKLITILKKTGSWLFFLRIVTRGDSVVDYLIPDRSVYYNCRLCCGDVVKESLNDIQCSVSSLTWVGGSSN